MSFYHLFFQFDDSTERGQKHIASFFTVFYFAINAGSLCSTFITPILRDISYVLAFAIPSILMAIALVLFLIGTPYYIRKPPSGQNIFSLFLGATWNALRNRFVDFFQNLELEIEIPKMTFSNVE